MKTMNLSELNIRLRSLAIFRALLDDPVITALCGYLDSLEQGSTAAAVSKYSGRIA